MRWRSYLAILLGIALVVGIWVVHVRYLNVYVNINAGGYSIEVPLTLLVLGSLLLSMALVICWKIFSLVVFFPAHLRAWKRRHNETKRVKYLVEGLQAMVLGVKPSQHKSFLAAADAGVSPAVTYYLAAATAENEAKSNSLLRKATSADGDPMIKAMASAQARLSSQLPSEAAEVLRIAGATTHRAVQPMKLLLDACEKSGDIRGALDIAQHLLERDPSPMLRARIGKLTSQLLADAGNAEDVRGLLGKVGKSSSPAASVAVAAANRLATVNDRQGASAILAKALEQHPETETFEAIARHGSDKLVRQALARSDRSLQNNPQNVLLLRAVAALAMREKLWAQARKLLEKALDIHEERATYLCLAKLAEAEGKPQEDANRLYRLAAQCVENDSN